MDKTRREKIIELLEIRSFSAREISEYFSTENKYVNEGDILEDIEHIKESISNTDKTLMVSPPKCKNCGFNDFDNKIDPTKCPSCTNSRLTSPMFKID